MIQRSKTLVYPLLSLRPLADMLKLSSMYFALCRDYNGKANFIKQNYCALNGRAVGGSVSKSLKRRHSRWYEVVLFSSLFQFFLGFAFVVLLPNWLRWGELLFDWPLKSVQFNTLLANSVAYAVSFFILHKFKRFPGTRSLPFIIPTILTAWLAVVAVLLFLREDTFARQVLMYSFVLANIWAFAGFFIGRRFSQPKLAVVPFGRALELADTPHAIITLLDQPSLGGRRYDAVVADLHAEDLPDDWERFLAKCTLARIPVFHYQQVKESLTGRVQINHLSENIFGSLQPSAFYSGVKRLVDIFAVFMLLPLLLPIMLLTAIAILIDSRGGVFYTQQRMGYRGKSFTMYKFRSMYTNIKGKDFTEGEEDPRITRVGSLIRKYRIDELPQILNILKSEMSFIGPRPESVELSNWYEKDVAFFSYRHIVRPGISGWAQVEQGYAAEVEGMNIKLQYDFYYIKHFSLWLDILIVVKTIRTIFTGFGAR